MAIRSPIVSVLGHVDHGKSSVLDAIRDSNILATEAGAITQAIGASIVPKEVLLNKAGKLLEALKVQLTIPGLLFIDTPGHAAFTSLRKRGGSLADIAVVVVDMNEGFKPQTIEAIEILRAAKTPFVVVANKIDLVHGFKPGPKDQPILGMINNQEPATVAAIETKLYEVVGQLHEKFELPSERFDRVTDFTKEIAIIPMSALKQLGLAELLMVISALAQKYLEQRLALDEDGAAKGTILEVKTEQGLGTTLDTIIYNGTLNVGDTVVIGGLDQPIVTRVKAMFEPAPLKEMRDKKSNYASVKEVTAATGVKLSCPDTDDVLSGMPIISADKTDESIEAAKVEVQKEISDILVETQKAGIIIKADNIGSLEALHVLLKEKDIPVRKASIGPISKKDIIDAESNFEEDPLTAVILGFNIPTEPSTDKIKIITSDVIYHIIESYEEWFAEREEQLRREHVDELLLPFKMHVLPNCIFRQSNPCIAGCEIIAGAAKVNVELMKANGNKLTTLKAMQLNKKNIQEAPKGEQVACELPNVTGGRQLNENDILYSHIPEPMFRTLRENAKYLSEEVKEILREIAEIHRKENPLWGK